MKLSTTKILKILDEECGWFDAFPTKGKKDKARTALRKHFLDQRGDEYVTPGLFSLDSECIYREGDYSSVFTYIQKNCYKLLGVAKPKERWENGKVVFTAKVNGKIYDFTTEVESDYISSDFIVFINEIMNAQYGNLFFIDLVTGGQEIELCLTSPEAFFKAQQKGFSWQSPMSTVDPAWLDESEEAGRKRLAEKFILQLECNNFFTPYPSELKQQVVTNIVNAAIEKNDPRAGLSVLDSGLRADKKSQDSNFNEMVPEWLKSIYRLLHPEYEIKILEVEIRSGAPPKFVAEINGVKISSDEAFMAQSWRFLREEDWDGYTPALAGLKAMVSAAHEKKLSTFYFDPITVQNKKAFMIHGDDTGNITLLESTEKLRAGKKLWQLLTTGNWVYGSE